MESTSQTSSPNSSPWKFGIFYYNKEDKRLFPPKRSKLGWTVNFANPFSIIAMIAVIVVTILIAKFIKSH